MATKPTDDMPPLNPGNAGETHQRAEDGYQTMTTAHGMPISDNQNTLSAGARGPALMEDQVFRDKMTHFDHERIPERVVHARGYGAHGFFENYDSLSDITKADLFQRPGEKTPIFVRFSTVAGSKGSVDLARDVRGFSIKFYTQEGNWDMVGNNIPVFFIQDPIKFPDLIHAVKQEPDREFPQAASAHDNFWDFISLMPEAMHMIMWTMSDRAIPRSFRFMEGFGIHTFRLINAEGESRFVKFHFKPKLGLQSVVWPEAVKINGAESDFHRRDLWNAIQSGDYPEWEVGFQLFDQEFADQFEFDILDPTKLIPEEVVPVRPVGRLVLNQMPDNFFAETEQVGFLPQNIVPGIDFSDDPLLQGRNFSYMDTKLRRLGGPNFAQLPINAPKTQVANFQQDGHMAYSNLTGRANYEPNSWGPEDGGPRETAAGFESFQEKFEAIKVRLRSDSFADHYSQARMFYMSQTPVEQTHIQDALIFELSKVEKEAIRERVVSRLLNIDQTLATTVADGLGIDPLPAPAETKVSVRTDLPTSDALSIVKRYPGTFKGRKLGVLVSENADAARLNALKQSVAAAGATMEIVAPTIAGITANDGSRIKADHRVDAGPSVLFDAVAIVVCKDHVDALAKLPAARDFAADAFAHCKFIGFNEPVMKLFAKAGITEDDLDAGFIPLPDGNAAQDLIEACGQLRYWDRAQNL